MNEYEIGVSHFALFAQSIGIGFLVGLERERHEGKIAGVRTFTLIALAGALSGYISSLAGLAYLPWILLLIVAASLLIAQYKSQALEPDTTSVVAALITFLLGYILWLGNSLLPAGLAIALTAILYFREELRGLPRHLSRQDIISFFQFAIIAFILLPILPNETYGPYQVFNPYQVGWLVMLISGISFLGYLALRMLSGKPGLFLVGLLGGLISTTATTLVYARYSKNISHFSSSAAMIILLSHLMLFVRVGVVVSVVEISMLRYMLPWIIGGLLAGLVCLVLLTRRIGADRQEFPELQVSNPTELKTALGFAFGFSLVLLLSAWMNDLFQSAGGYLVAFVSGATDIDAINIANLKLFSLGAIDAQVAVNAVIIAFTANLLFKLGIVFVVGDKLLRVPAIIGFFILLAGVLSGLLLLSPLINT